MSRPERQGATTRSGQRPRRGERCAGVEHGKRRASRMLRMEKVARKRGRGSVILGTMLALDTTSPPTWLVLAEEQVDPSLIARRGSRMMGSTYLSYRRSRRSR